MNRVLILVLLLLSLEGCRDLPDGCQQVRLKDGFGNSFLLPTHAGPEGARMIGYGNEGTFSEYRYETIEYTWDELREKFRKNSTKIDELQRACSGEAVNTLESSTEPTPN